MPRWTPEARLKQAAFLRALCPWKKSTGPRTEEGKARSSRNAWKGGIRVMSAGWNKVLREVQATTKAAYSSFCKKREYSPRRTFSPKPVPPILLPTMPFMDLGPPLPPDPELESLSTDDFIKMAEQMLGGMDLMGGAL